MLEELLSVACLQHINEVDHDNAAHIPEAKLSSDLRSGCQINVDSGLLLGIATFGSIATVDIDHVHGLCMLNDQISSTFIGDSPSEQRLDLLRDPEIVEDGECSGIFLDNLLFAGSDQADIIAHVVIDFLVVYINMFERGVENIAQQGDCASCLLINDGGQRRFGQLLDTIFPTFHQCL